MNIHLKVAVIGGTGKSGTYLTQLLQQNGYHIKLLVRNPAKAPENLTNIELVQGDISDYTTVYNLLSGCHAVISTLGMGIPASVPTIFTQSTANVLQAMEALHINRYIVTTGLNVDTPTDKKGLATQAGTDWMKKTFPASTANKQQEYELLAASKVNFTMVRLPLIEQTDESPSVITSLTDCPGNKISATSLGCFLIEQLTSTQFIRQAPFVANV